MTGPSDTDSDVLHARTVTPSWRRGRTVVSLLLVLALLIEFATLLLMTVIRYRSQRMDPVLLDLSKSGNVVALVTWLPGAIAIIVCLLRRRRPSHRRSMWIAAMSASSLAVLTAAPLLTSTLSFIPQSGYLLFLAARLLQFSVLVDPWNGAESASRWRPPVRVVGRAAVIGMISFLLVIASVLFSPFGGAVVSEPKGEFDAGVILGAAVWKKDRPSPVLRERINTGFDLYRNGTIQFLVLTGSNAPNEMPEAEVARRELIARGVDPTRVVVETNTGSTLEQILFLRDNIKKKQGWSTFIIISDQFHLKRALEICRFNNLDAIGVFSESPLGPQNLAFYHIRESAALALYWLFGI